MKESKFIELLNLYVDHEISADDAALLEAEIERNPERRRIYRQYCMVQKACTVIAHDFREEAPLSGNVVAFPVRRSRTPVWMAVGSLAAAACVALVLVTRDGNQPAAISAQDKTPATQNVALATPPAPAPMALRTGVVARPALQPVFTGLVADAPQNSESALAGADLGQLDWMKRVNLQRMSDEELIFNARPSLHPADVRTFQSRQPLKANVEMTAFKFQR